MRPVLTILCTIIFGICGISLAVAEKEHASATQQTIRAATLMSPPMVMPDLSKLPLDIQLDLEKKYTKIDTVYVPQEYVVVGKSKVNNQTPKRARIRAKAATKRMGLSNPAVEPDTVVKNQIRGVREEQTLDSIGPPKGSICLTVDGEVVYKR